MKRVTAILMLFILVLNSSCVSKDGNPKATNTEVSKTISVPLIMFFPVVYNSQKEASQRKTFLGRWNLKTGGISFENISLPYKDKIRDSGFFKLVWDSDRVINSKTFLKVGSPAVVHRPSSGKVIIMAYFQQTHEPSAKGSTFEKGQIVVEIHKGDNIEKRLLKPELPKDASGPYPLLLYGKPGDFTVLATYDHPSRHMPGSIVGSLVVCNVREAHVKYQKVSGDYCSFIAGAGSDLVKLGDKIFMDACGGQVKLLDLESNALRLADYKPANDLINMVKPRFTETPLALSFGSYKDVLLMSALGLDEQWIWAIRNDKCVVKININFKRKEMFLYKGNELVAKRALPSPLDGILLPKAGYATWK